MTNRQVIKKVADLVKQKFAGEGSGHDWYHIERVWKNVKLIAKSEKGANMVVVELGALLHDIADWKFHDGDLTAGPREANKILTPLKVKPVIVEKVCYIVEHVSFKGSKVKDVMEGLEGQIVQDADRLDAMGAVGIARCFAYGGYKNRPLYIPGQKIRSPKSFEDYKKGEASSVNHFYEKLLLLKDRMHTKTAKKLAARRHKFMKNYLKQFFSEWEGLR